MGVEDEIRDYWDEDAATYDRSRTHRAATATERAAWAAALCRLLPPSGRVLDAGAGTGFLSLALARLGYEVTALDLSGAMLARLRQRADAEGVAIATHHAPADEPPDGAFDAVVERHLLWTLPDPRRALEAWRAAAPRGRLVVFEGLWGSADGVEGAHQRVRATYNRLLRRQPDHHDEYEAHVQATLPLGTGAHPDAIVELVEASGWRRVTIERLRDVEWARLLALPPHERVLGVTPVYAVSAA